MTFSVETGAGVSGANAYVSTAYVDAHATLTAQAGWSGTDEAKQAAIVRASLYLDAFEWQGERTRYRQQGLQWPRQGVVDREGQPIDHDEMPDELLKAAAELAIQELVSPRSLQPSDTPSERVKSERVGPLSTEYAFPGGDTAAQIESALALVRQFMLGHSDSGELIRA